MENKKQSLLEKYAKQWAVLLQLIKFGCVGLFNTFVSIGVAHLLVWMGVNRNIGVLAGYACGMLSSLLLNSRWTFETKKMNKKQVISFIILNVVIALLQTFLVGVVQDTFDVKLIVAQIIVIPIGTLINFAGNRLFIFKK